MEKVQTTIEKTRVSGLDAVLSHPTRKEAYDKLKAEYEESLVKEVPANATPEEKQKLLQEAEKAKKRIDKYVEYWSKYAGAGQGTPPTPKWDSEKEEYVPHSILV